MKKILCVHQGSELYGSDRSFYLSLLVIRRDFPESKITVVLPSKGKLSNLIGSVADDILYLCVGNIARSELKEPFKCLLKVFRSAVQARKLIKKYDVVYLNTLVVFSFIIASMSLPIKSCHHIREVPNSKLEKVVFSMLLYFSNSMLIFNSQFTKSSFFTRSRKSYVVLNGIEDTAINKHLSTEDKDGSYQGLKIVVVGRINTWKGQKVAVEALGKLIDLGYEAHLTIVGSVATGQDYLLDELLIFIDFLGLNEYVTLSGFVDDTSNYYLSADVSVVPSIRPEPFGRVAAEAMAFGVPVIASNIGGLPEVISNGTDGLLFEPGNAIDLADKLEFLINNSDVFKKMRIASLKSFENNFSEASYQARFSDIVNKII